MSMSANLHDLKTVEAEILEGCQNDVLKLRAADGSFVSVFMPYSIAVSMADAFNGVTRETTAHRGKVIDFNAAARIAADVTADLYVVAEYEVWGQNATDNRYEARAKSASKAAWIGVARLADAFGAKLVENYPARADWDEVLRTSEPEEQHGDAAIGGAV